MTPILEYLLSKKNVNNIEKERNAHNGYAIGDLIQYEWAKNNSYFVIVKFDPDYDDIIYTIEILIGIHDSPDPENDLKNAQWERYANSMAYRFGHMKNIKETIGHYKLPNNAIEAFEKAPATYSISHKK